MKISEKQIHDISQELQTGLKIFINRKTYGIKSILDPNEFYSDPEIWEEELEEIESEWSDYSVIEKMESWGSISSYERFH